MREWLTVLVAIYILLVAVVIRFVVFAINYGTLKKIAFVVFAVGVPFHELGHVVPMALFRVRMVHVSLLQYTNEDGGMEIGGSVTFDPSTVPHALAAPFSSISCSSVHHGLLVSVTATFENEVPVDPEWNRGREITLKIIALNFRFTGKYP